VNSVVDHLISIGTLDDRHFAERFAEDKRELAGWGSDRIRAALLGRGISAADAEEAIAGGGEDDGDAEVERAVALLRSRQTDVDDDRGRNRALGLLARRGYDAEVAYEAIRRAEREEPAR
jgi:regulatory protein